MGRSKHAEGSVVVVAVAVARRQGKRCDYVLDDSLTLATRSYSTHRSYGSVPTTLRGPCWSTQLARLHVPGVDRLIDLCLPPVQCCRWQSRMGMYIPVSLPCICIVPSVDEVSQRSIRC